MNRAELTTAVAARSGLSLSHVDSVVVALTSVITQELVEGRRVVLPGFATFDVVARPSRMGRNPRTGEPLEIPARRVPRLTPGASLKRTVAGS